MTTTERKRFQTPVMAGVYLGHGTEPDEVDWSDIAADDAAERTAQAQGTIPSDGNERRARLRRPITRRRAGNVIRKMLRTA